MERDKVVRQTHTEGIAHAAFFFAAMISVGAVAAICVFIMAGGMPAMLRIGVLPFITGRVWRPEQEVFGILPMIAASLCVTFVSLVLAVCPALMTAVFIARYASRGVKEVCYQAVSLLAGIPSVVYGYFGLTAVVPLASMAAGGSGSSILSAGIVLAMMIIPTITNIAVSSLEAVPPLYAEGSLALGVCRERGIFLVEMRAARSGITSGIVLGISRAIGETMAVIMVAGNQCAMPSSLFRGARTMTSNIALEMGYAAGLHRGALLATAVVLFVFCLVINALFMMLKARKER